MKIVLTGGGSGGHITPLLAVAQELKTLAPDAEIVYIGQRGDKLSDIPAQDPNIDAVYTVWAGKLRRYADESWPTRLTDFRTQALNIRDAFRLLRGTAQSFWLLRKLRPAVIFTRGGFVSVPVAIGGRLNRIPYITHDSDSVPSLANRLIAKGATRHAVALPADVYPYPLAKTVSLGVPVSRQCQLVTPSLQARYKNELQLEQYEQVLFLTGGGNGSRTLNMALVANAVYLLKTYPKLFVLHVAGRELVQETEAAYDALQLGSSRERIRVQGFITDFYRQSGAADVIVARGGATNLAEFAIQEKACIIVPAPQLVGDHQTKNARAMASRGAIVQLNEDQIEQPERLGRTVGELLDQPAKRQSLAQKLGEYAHPQAAAELAALVIEVAAEGSYARPQK